MVKSSNLKSIKIVSDGRISSGTRIMDKDGKFIGCVQSVDIHMSTGDAVVSADLTMVLPEIEVEAYDVLLNDKRTIEDEIFAEEFFKDVEFPVYEVGSSDPVFVKGDK